MATTKTAPTKADPTVKTGGALRPAVNIADDMAAAIIEQIGLMARQTRREMLKALSSGGFDHAMDDNPASQARIRLNWLREKWMARFRDLSKMQVDRMIDRTIKNSTVTLGMSLKEVSEGFKIDTALSSERLQTVIMASTQEAAQLIKRIPEQYLSDVQGHVMRAITTGSGQADLVPFFTKRYEGDVKWARHVSMDQQRKAYANINQVRLQAMGVQSYIWVHTGGGRYPRKDHIEMNGKEYRYDDPPVIQKATGARGKPGDAIFCRCIAKPVFRFNNDNT
jgi:SPP1 gp7 family putative phage head morphogenesis protein